MDSSCTPLHLTGHLSHLSTQTTSLFWCIQSYSKVTHFKMTFPTYYLLVCIGVLGVYYLWSFSKNTHIYCLYVLIEGERVCVRTCILIFIVCACLCLSTVSVCLLFCFFCVELEAREPAIKKRTGTSKGLEAQTQHTCWQSIGKPGEVKLERERGSGRKRAEMSEGRRRRAGWVHVGEKGRTREKEGGLRLRQRTHILSSALSLVEACKRQHVLCMCCNVCVCVCIESNAALESGRDVSLMQGFPCLLPERTRADCLLSTTGN